MSIITIQTRLDKARADLSAFDKQAAEDRKAITDLIATLERDKALFAVDVTPCRIELAESVMKFRGDPTKDPKGKRAVLIEAAISDISAGCRKLKTEYLGIKNYSGFGDQREDHRYGMGPRHGNIVFSIELRRPKESLTEEQAESCIYYLMNWKKIHEASKQAAA